MFRWTNVPLDECSVVESALDESVVDESTPTPLTAARLIADVFSSLNPFAVAKIIAQ